MAITWSNVVNIAPETAALPVGAQSQILTTVARELNPDSWGSRLGDGSAYLAAHMATLALRQGSGPTSSEQLGPMATTFVNLIQIHGTLGTTAYGVEYLRMVRLLPSALGLVP
jgi:hypothetical protein